MSSTAPAPAAARDVVPLVVFSLGGHPHAVETERVQEVVRMVALAPVPGAPDWVAGLVNLRGTPVPVIDLRLRLGIGVPTIGLATPIIIARTSAGRGVGLIPDTIVELHDVAAEALTPVGGDGLVGGVARIGSRLVNVADVDALAVGTEHLVGP